MTTGSHQLSNMIRIIKEWWLVRQVHNECKNHEIKLPTQQLLFNNRFVVARDAMIAQVARQSTTRGSWLLRWRKKENSYKLNKRVREYNSIMDSCLRDNYIHVEQNQLPDELGNVLNDNRPFIRTTDLGDSFTSFSSLTLSLGKQLNTIGVVVAWLASIAIAIIGTYIAAHQTP